MSSKKANKIYIVCPLDKYNINRFLDKIKSLRTRFENEGLEYFHDCYFTHQEILELLDPQKTTIDDAESYNHYIKNIFKIDTPLWVIHSNIKIAENESIMLNNREEIKLTEHEVIILNNREEIKFIYVCNEYNKDIICEKYVRTFEDFDIKIMYEKYDKNINNIEINNNYSLSAPMIFNIEKLKYDFFYEYYKGNEIKERKYKILLVTPINFNPIGIDAPDEESWWTFETINNELIKHKEKLDRLWKENVTKLIKHYNFNGCDVFILKTKQNYKGFLRRIEAVTSDNIRYFYGYEEETIDNNQNISLKRGSERASFVEYYKKYGNCYALYCHGWKNCKRAIYDHNKLNKTGVPSLYAPGEEL